MVLIEDPIIKLLVKHCHSPTTDVFLHRLEAIPSDKWTDDHVACLLQNMCPGGAVMSSEFDRFVWSVLFRPNFPRTLYLNLLQVHPRCKDSNHWCNYIRLHAGIVDTDPMAKLEQSQQSPLQRLVRNNTRPGDMAIVLHNLIAVDNGVARRWVTAAFGHDVKDDAASKAIPWDTIVCWIIGNVVLFAHQSEPREILSDSQQEQIMILLLRLGAVPQYTAWFLRALIFHANDYYLRTACYRWWWRHTKIVPSLVEQSVILLPCLSHLASRCQSMFANEDEYKDGRLEVFGSMIFSNT